MCSVAIKTGTLTTNELKLEKILAKDEKEFLELVASLSFDVSQKYLSDFSKVIMNKLKEEIKKELREIKLINRKLFDPSLRISQAILETKEKKKFLVVSGAQIICWNIAKTEKNGKTQLKIGLKKVLGFMVWQKRNGDRRIY